MRRLFILCLCLGLVECSYQIKPDSSDASASRPHKSRIKDDTADAESSANDDSTPPPPPPMSSNDDPNVESGGAVAAGAVSPSESRKSEVRKLIMQKKLDIRSCYTHAFGVDKVKGQVVYEWQYNERGKVTKITMVSSDFQRPRFEKCIEKVVQSITFPKSDTEVISKVKYPFQFQ